jgi:anti-sigma-K factor RskA
MKPQNPDTRSILAAEYVLGTLHGQARRRFEHWMKSDPALRREVGRWEARLNPLNDTLPAVAPSPAVWKAIEARIAPSREPAGADQPSWLGSLAFWRWTSFVSAGLASVLLAFVVVTTGRSDPAGPEEAMVVVMEDSDTRNPSMSVAWSPEGRGKPRLRIRVIGHAEMAPGTAWELWAMPEGNQPPRSLGLINTHETQWVEVPEELRHQLNKAAGMAMSLEPAGGSPTGRPSGPVLASGKCLRI